MYDIFYISPRSTGVIKLRQRFPLAKHATSVKEAQQKCFTKMFWIIWDDIEIDNSFDFNYIVPEWDQKYIHVFKNKDQYDGLCLIPKSANLTDRECKHRYFLEKKEIDIIASQPKLYDIFAIDSYEEYVDALENSSTEMFWMTSKNLKIADNFKFDLFFDHHNVYDRNQNHAFIHIEDGKESYDGVFLCSVNVPLTKREIDFRFPVARKEWDIIASRPKPYDIFEIDSYEDYLNALDNTSTELFWATSKDLKVVDNFKFDDFYFSKKTQLYDFDRNQNHAFIHIEDGKESYDGVFLCSIHAPLTKREIDFRFPVARKEWNIVASVPKPYDIFDVENYNDYKFALENTTTELFWVTSKNLKIADNFKFDDFYFSKKTDAYQYDRNQNHAFIHKVNDVDYYNGVFLCSIHAPLTKKEIDFRFPVARKEWDIVASGPCQYDSFVIDTYDDYLNAIENAKTELVWLIPYEVEVLKDFKFDLYFTHDDVYNRSENHVFKHMFGNTQTYNGIMLVPKNQKLSKKEIDFRFLVNKKEHDIVASVHKKYDIIFISYNEPNADENYELLKSKFPRAKRIHKIKGIHNAHKAAARESSTHMFWVVDGDAIIKDDFTFDYLVTRYEKDIVHTWKSENPINGLIYGYGGVKLLPKELTMNMNVRGTDMTTAISNKFKLIDDVSNVTSFNTDPFNTWKSAFRECVKLSSKIIQGQIDTETEDRLNIWCTVATGKFAINALRGANAGRIYGQENAGNLPALSKINDFKWLEQEFKRTSVLR